MKYVHHTALDKQKWDRLTSKCPTPNLYVQSWYLDAACERWDAIIWGDYDAGLPLPVKQKAFLQIAYLPYFIQQTGIVYLNTTQAALYLQEFLQSELFYRFYSFRCHFPSHFPIAPHLPTNTKARLETRKNYLLPLHPSYELLSKGYNDNRKRNLKKATKLGWKCVASKDIGAATEMYEQYQGIKQKDFHPRIFRELHSLYANASQKGLTELLACQDGDNCILAYALFIRFGKRIYYLFGTMNETGKQHSAISLLFDSIIQKYASEDMVLDFEGGNLEGIGTYFASFGACPEPFYSLSYKKSPFELLLGH